MKIEPKVEIEKNGDVKLKFPGQKPIEIPREIIPSVVEMLKDAAHKLNSTLDRITEDDDEEENLGNLAMG